MATKENPNLATLARQVTTRGEAEKLQQALTTSLHTVDQLNDEDFQQHMEFVLSIDSSEHRSSILLQDPLAVNYLEAKNSRDWPLYKKAMDKEIQKLEQKYNIYGPWEPRQPGMIVVGTMWTPFKLRATEVKARLALRGDQVPKEDRGETSSPTVRGITRNAISIKVANTPGAVLITSDIEAAYLTGRANPNNKPVYISQIPGYFLPERQNMVREVIGNQYGGCDAGVIWRNAYHHVYTDLGFKCSRADNCLYSIQREQGWLDVGVQVDDGWTAFNHKTLFDWYITEISKHFVINISKVLDKFMGYDHVFLKDQGAIAVKATEFIDHLLDITKMKDCRPALSPYIAGLPVEDLFAKSTEEKQRNFEFVN